MLIIPIYCLFEKPHPLFNMFEYNSLLDNQQKTLLCQIILIDNIIIRIPESF